MASNEEMRTDAAAEVKIVDLDNETLRKISSMLPATEVAAAMLVRKQWKDALDDNRLWWRFCREDYGTGAVVKSRGRVIVSLADGFEAERDYRTSYAFWHENFAEFRHNKPLVRRAMKMWERIRTWMAENHPAVRSSLASPATMHELEILENELQVRLPEEFRAVYRAFNGQHLEFDELYDEWAREMVGFSLDDAPADPSSRHGLFGGYSFYEMNVCTSMMPWERIVMWTERLVDQGMPDHLIIFAASGPTKFVALDTRTGQIVGLDRHRRPVPMCPRGKTILDWMEEFARRLEAGAYSLVKQRMSPLGFDDGFGDTQALSLYPQRAEEGMRECITHGVRVRVSSVYAPEQSLGTRGGFFAYSVRFYLLPTEEQEALAAADGGPFRPKLSVQLASRHWVLRDSRNQVYDTVDGEGVVGMHPRLTPGGEEFVYQSCTQTRELSNSMEGHFTFVEGTLGNQTGPKFDVTCPRFDLKVPDYAY